VLLDCLKKSFYCIKSDDWRMKFEIDSFEFWEPPEEISSQFAVYHTGFDNEGRPGNLFKKKLDFMNV
jgi:hypothetical protein